MLTTKPFKVLNKAHSVCVVHLSSKVLLILIACYQCPYDAPSLIIRLCLQGSNRACPIQEHISVECWCNEGHDESGMSLFQCLKQKGGSRQHFQSDGWSTFTIPAFLQFEQVSEFCDEIWRNLV